MMARAIVYALMLGKGLGWIFLASAIFTETIWTFITHGPSVICG